MLSPKLQHLPFGKACVEFLALKRLERGWKWSTVETRMGNLAGALCRLSEYVPGQVKDLKLSDDPSWRDAFSFVERKAKQETCKQSRGASLEEVSSVISSLLRCAEPAVGTAVAMI